MLKAWTKSAKPQCLCGFPTLSYYNALVDSSDDSCGFHLSIPPFNMFSKVLLFSKYL